jgi:hypothetical protein
MCRSFSIGACSASPFGRPTPFLAFAHPHRQPLLNRQAGSGVSTTGASGSVGVRQTHRLVRVESRSARWRSRRRTGQRTGHHAEGAGTQPRPRARPAPKGGRSWHANEDGRRVRGRCGCDQLRVGMLINPPHDGGISLSFKRGHVHTAVGPNDPFEGGFDAVQSLQLLNDVVGTPVSSKGPVRPTLKKPPRERARPPIRWPPRFPHGVHAAGPDLTHTVDGTQTLGADRRAASLDGTGSHSQILCQLAQNR